MKTILIFATLNYPQAWDNAKHIAHWTKHEVVCLAHMKAKCK